MKVRKACKQDAVHLAPLINLAGEGIPFYLWGQMKGANQTTTEFGELRAAREEGGFSYKHAWVAEEEKQVAAMLLGYKQPDPYELDDIDEYPEVVRGIVELESMAPGSWYINALAVYAQFRCRGFGQQLLEFAEVIGREVGVDSLSLIVASENEDARRLYEKQGFVPQASRRIVAFPGFPMTGHWILMIKRLC